MIWLTRVLMARPGTPVAVTVDDLPSVGNAKQLAASAAVYTSDRAVALLAERGADIRGRLSKSIEDGDARCGRRDLPATIVIPGHGTHFDRGLLDRIDQLLDAAR